MTRCTFSYRSSTPPRADDTTEIPGIGLRFRLDEDRAVTLLGNGRSLNLFEADSIPNQGYDAYRAGTLIAARHLCTDPGSIPPGLHSAPAGTAIHESGLFEAYYDHYFAPHRPSSLRIPARVSVRERGVAKACVIGYGVAGRLHATILEDLGADLAIIDPKHQDLLPQPRHTFTHHVNELPARVAKGIDLWSICCPTADHLPVLRAVLAHNPVARILLEKPACQGHEIGAFTDLLDQHPHARIVVNDQYRHSQTLPAFIDLVHCFEEQRELAGQFRSEFALLRLQEGEGVVRHQPYHPVLCHVDRPEIACTVERVETGVHKRRRVPDIVQHRRHLQDFAVVPNERREPPGAGCNAP